MRSWKVFFIVILQNQQICTYFGEKERIVKCEIWISKLGLIIFFKYCLKQWCFYISFQKTLVIWWDKVIKHFILHIFTSKWLWPKWTGQQYMDSLTCGDTLLLKARHMLLWSKISKKVQFDEVTQISPKKWTEERRKKFHK